MNSHTSSELNVNSNIDMKGHYGIINLRDPLYKDEPATKQYVDNKLEDIEKNLVTLNNLIIYQIQKKSN